MRRPRLPVLPGADLAASDPREGGRRIAVQWWWVMPVRASRPCVRPGCPNLQPCAAHRRPTFVRATPRRQPGGNGWAWQRIRQRILERDGYRCQLQLEGCTGTGEVIDHVLNVARGGSDDHENLRAACRACNECKRRTEARMGRVG